MFTYTVRGTMEARIKQLPTWVLLWAIISATSLLGKSDSSPETGDSPRASLLPRFHRPSYRRLVGTPSPRPTTLPAPVRGPSPTPPPGADGYPHPYPDLIRELESVVKDAYDIEKAENEVLRQRHNGGIDKLPEEFDDIAPPILGSTNRGIGGKVSVIAEASRVINWIKAHPRGYSTPPSLFLHTQTARDHHLTCPYKARRCSPDAKYRAVDGQCNNLNNPLWGSSFTPLARDLPPKYDSGYVNADRQRYRRDLPRQTGRRGEPLPNARLVSNVVHNSGPAPIRRPGTAGLETNMLYTNYGQAMSHDLDDTPMEGGFLNARLNCCNKGYQTRRCAGITIPDVDFFRQFKRSCMNFFRSREVTDITCNSGVRQQLNVATSFVDGTQVYGHSAEEMEALMDGEGGLKVSFPNYLPLQKHPNDKAFERGVNFLMSGDEKVSESTGLIGAVTIWHREHNRIAKKLAEFSRFSQRPDLIFEEARKIVIAEMQHVTYKEYLPITVGPTVTAQYKLKPQKDGFFRGYNPYVDPSITNEFATAIFRFGHSMVRNDFSLLAKNYQPTGKSLRLKKIFWRSNFYLRFEDGFQRGVLTDTSEVCDRHVSIDLRNHMFETKTGNGLDLAAINIQRGRDHGLQPYAEYRKLASLSVPTEWSTHPTRGFPDFDIDTLQRFQRVYGNPADVDLWSAGISEIPVAGGQVGPLYSKLLARQFVNLKIGDRFWYEREETGFTLARLNTIRNVSLARIMCNNLEHLHSIQPEAFLEPLGRNGRRPCSSLPDMNLDLWQ